MVKVKKIELWEGAVDTAIAMAGESDDLKYAVAVLVQHSIKNRLSKDRRKVLREYAKKVWNERKYK